jgi:hypothetical protein
MERIWELYVDRILEKPLFCKCFFILSKYSIVRMPLLNQKDKCGGREPPAADFGQRSTQSAVAYQYDIANRLTNVGSVDYTIKNRLITVNYCYGDIYRYTYDVYRVD